MRSKKGSSNYLIKVGGERYETTSIRRFTTHVASIKWGNLPSVYLRVSYGIQKDHRGKMNYFYNEGDYSNKHEFTQALRAFLEG